MNQEHGSVDVGTTAVAAMALFTPTFGVAIAQSTESPIIGGVAVLVATVLLVPVVRWMMTRQDTLQKESSEAAVRREEREEKRAEAFAQQVTALAAIVQELRLMNDHHKEMDAARGDAVKEILERIDGLPDRIVKKCNGAA